MAGRSRLPVLRTGRPQVRAQGTRILLLTRGDETAEDAEAAEDAQAGEVEAEGDEAEDEGPDPRLAFLIELTDAADVAVVERIGATVAERRGLALLEPVPVYLLRRDDVPAYFDADDEVSEADERGDRFDDRVLQMLGIIWAGGVAGRLVPQPLCGAGAGLLRL